MFITYKFQFYAYFILIEWLIIKCNYSKVLEDHRVTCEREGKYVEAEMAKNRVAELKQQDFDRRYQELVFN